jgi:pimeloyl-ACP methyl ester carboxylesterase
VALELYTQTFGRIEETADMEYAVWEEKNPVKYSREEVYFNSGGNKLQGFIYGRGNANGLVVVSEGLGSTADGYLPMIMYFVDKGWRVFAFNNTGVGGSEGESVRGLTQSVIDLDAALTYIENSGGFNGLPVMLAGHSWGGYGVCAVLHYNHDIKAVVSFAGFNSSGEIFQEQGIAMTGSWYYMLKPQMWIIEKQLFGDLTNLSAVDGINKSGIPVMIVHCANDEVIPAHTTSIYAHRAKITNPYVEIVYREGEDAAGHYPHLSKPWNELDTVLMNRIDAFFNGAKDAGK